MFHRSIYASIAVPGGNEASKRGSFVFDGFAAFDGGAKASHRVACSSSHLAFPAVAGGRGGGGGGGDSGSSLAVFRLQDSRDCGGSNKFKCKFF